MKELDLLKLAKYAATATTITIALINVMAYLRQSLINLLLGIRIPPTIDQITIISLSISLVGFLAFIALPIAYYFLKAKHPINRQIKLINVAIIPITLIGLFVATDLPTEHTSKTFISP